MKVDKRHSITPSDVHKGMTDIMVDIETTGLDTAKNAIAQIGAKKFNITTGEMSDDVFIVNVAMLEGRTWDESTRRWWDSQDKAIREGVFENPYPADVALNAFANWCFPMNSLRFWCKGSHFDYPFIEGYFKELGIPNPFLYRVAKDMNSFISGLYYPNPRPVVDYKDVGGAHNALSDSINQLTELFAHVENAKNV